MMAVRAAGAATVALACLAAQGCGGSGGGATATSTTAETPRDTGTTIATPASAARRGPLGDGDADNPADIDGDAEAAGNLSEGEYRDNDGENDARTPASRGYHDADDRSSLSYGRPANAAQLRAVTVVVDAYFAAAAAQNGVAACALLPARMARSAPEEYGQGGEFYLQGAHTCPELLARIFAHIRGLLAGAMRVTGVRVQGASAQAFLASPTMLSSEIALTREGSSWRVRQLLPSQLP